MVGDCQRITILTISEQELSLCNRCTRARWAYFLARSGMIAPPGWVVSNLAPSASAKFMADWWAHSASYATGLVGGIVLCIAQYRTRIRMHSASRPV
jgi:hypothetical protein